MVDDGHQIDVHTLAEMRALGDTHTVLDIREPLLHEIFVRAVGGVSDE